MASIASLLKSSNKGLIKNALSGAGLTLATAGTTLIVFNQMLDNFRDNITGVPPAILGLAHVAGFDVFFSLIFGAYVARFTLNAGNVSLRKVQK